MFDRLQSFISLTSREFRDLESLLSPANKQARQLVFYSERDIYYKYYEDYINYILSNSTLEIAYITSDPDDRVFRQTHEHIKPFYIKSLLAKAFSMLDSKVLVMTAPDLNQKGAIKRAAEPVHHVYVFHAISSTHRCYKHGAFDNYDTVLCVADYQANEIRRYEEVFGLKKKNLVVAGYPLLERIYEEHQLRGKPNNKRPLIVIAPTWGKCSIPESCANELIECLRATPYDVIFRPHPEFAKRNPAAAKDLQKRIEKTDNIKLQPKFDSFEALHTADMLITDHSGVVFEYVLGTERSVLFIDTPDGRLDNPYWEKLGLSAVEVTHRYRMGKGVAPDRLYELPSVMELIFSEEAEFKKTVPQLRDELVSNWQRSAKIGAEAILEQCEAKKVTP